MADSEGGGKGERPAELDGIHISVSSDRLIQRGSAGEGSLVGYWLTVVGCAEVEGGAEDCHCQHRR